MPPPEHEAAIAAFYDGLAPHYHHLYADWERSVARQGEVLSALLAAVGVVPGDPVLDAACGIGTQTLGLLARGHDVTASDIAPGAIERLRGELRRRGLTATDLRVDDLRSLAAAGDGSFAAVIACDNSLPHLQTEAEIGQSLCAAWRVLRPGGALVLSVRDYAAIPRVSPDVKPYGVHEEEGRRFLAVQVWTWLDEAHYELSLYLTTEDLASGHCHTQVLRSRYHAITIARLQALLAEAGFEAVTRDDGLLFQPVITARRPVEG